MEIQPFIRHFSLRYLALTRSTVASMGPSDIDGCDTLRKSKERVGVDASSLFTRFGGRPLEHNSSKTNDNKGDKQVQATET
jgi:hypothetical protein